VPTYVIDASAGVEYLLRTPTGMSFSEMLDEADLFAPELIDVEILSALRRAVQRDLLDPVRAEEAVEDLAAWPLERVPHRGLGADVWRLRHNFTAYDATYVAVARSLQACLVTADGPLARAPNPGIAILNITAP